MSDKNKLVHWDQLWLVFVVVTLGYFFGPVTAAIVFAALFISDGISYVHGHRTYFHEAKTDYEKALLERVRGEPNDER